jgi:signal transduction histidine kinase
MQDTPLKIEQQPKIKTEKIKLPVLAPLLTSILVLLSTFTIAIYKLERKNITDDLYKRLYNAQKFFSNEPKQDGRLFGAMIQLLQSDREIQKLWLAHDRNGLHLYISPIFKKLRDDYRITHLYFIDVNQVCFLRAHKPAGFGDFIDRTTLNNASQTQKTSSGIELGKFGTFTFRLVQPWYINNTLTGYIEFGEEIGDIALHLKEILDADLVFLVDKKFLTCEDWQQGRKMMSRSGDWDFLPNSVIADSTIKTIPPELLKLAALPPAEYRNRTISTTIDGFTYLGGVVDLRDAAGQRVGSMLVVKDVSQSEAALNELLTIVAALCFIIATMLASFFYIHITRIEKNLIEARGKLETEIEKRKRADIELRKQQDRLEDIVKHRTVELEKAIRRLCQEVEQRTKAEVSLESANEELESTITKLIQSNRQLWEFAHLSAHDLKTPLRGISILAQWLAADYRDKFDEQGRRQIDMLVKRTIRLDKLIDAILQYSTLTRHRQNERPTDLNVMVKKVAAEIKCPPNIKITIKNNLPVLVCNENHIRQVLYNLIDNAVKFIDKPEGLVVIDCTEKEHFWEISISDNGPGIERQYFEKIWTLFQTLDIRDKTENTGFGLTLVRKIVELYEGQCWLKSEIAKGSTFYFTMPKQAHAATTKNLQIAQSSA